MGLDSRGFRKIIETALEQIASYIEDYFTSEFRDEEGIYTLQQALEKIHKKHI